MIRHNKSFILGLCCLLAACATRATPEDVQMADALCTQGKTLLAAHKNSEAKDIYASATQRDGQNARAWNGLGVSYDLLGKHDDAASAYRHAIDLSPHDMTAINNLAHYYIETGKDDEAVRLLTPYMNDPTATPTVLQNLAVATKAAQMKEGVTSDVYADLGTYPTEGMAEGRMSEVRELLNDSNVVLSVASDIKVGGGTPVFTLKATGKPPRTICDDLNAKAFPCIPIGK